MSSSLIILSSVDSLDLLDKKSSTEHMSIASSTYIKKLNLSDVLARSLM